MEVVCLSTFTGITSHAVVHTLIGSHTTDASETLFKAMITDAIYVTEAQCTDRILERVVFDTRAAGEGSNPNRPP